MKWKSKGLISLLMLVLMAGCTPDHVIYENPYFGYVYNLAKQGDSHFDQSIVNADLERYKKTIAKEKLAEREREFRGIQHEKSLEKWNSYILELQRPITIKKVDWKGSIDRELPKKKEKEAFLTYWNNTPSISFVGKEALDEWADLLSMAEAQQSSNKRNAKTVDSAISNLRNRNYYREALKKVKELRPYSPEAADTLVLTLKEEGTEYWGNKHLETLKELADDDKVYDGAHEQQVMDVYEQVCGDITVFGGGATFNMILSKWQNLLSENWRRQIVARGDDKAYWAAYQFAWNRYRNYVNTIDYAEEYRKGLKQGITKGYFDILGNAIRYYSDLATKNNTRSFHGKAYIYSCMAKEMYDFSYLADLGSNKDVEKKYKWLADLEQDELLPPLNDQVARRLVVYNFDYDELGLAKKFRETCEEKYAPGNNHAWQLEVITDKVVQAKFETGALPVEDDDYVVDWEWSPTDYDVRERVGDNTPEFVYIKTDRINLVENPDKFRKDKNSDFYKLKQIKAQEVDQYLLSKTPKSIELSCKVSATCQHHGKSQFELAGTRNYIKNINTKYGNITNVKVSLMRKNESAETKYFFPDQYNNTIPQDTPPRDRIHTLPSDEKIEEELAGQIIKDVDAELQELIDMYPINLLADTDPVNTSSEYFDALGTVLFYVANLSTTETEKRGTAGQGYEWLHLRNQIAEDTKKWCKAGERWAAIGADKKEIMSSLWEKCIDVGNEQDAH